MIRHLRTFGLVGALSLTAAAPLAAETVSVCYDRVIAECDEALANSRWWEKPAVGVLCTAMLAGCTGSAFGAI